MDFGLEVRELDPPHSVAVACFGVSGHGDVARLEAVATDPTVRAARRVVLDLRRLGSASPYLVRAMVAWQRSLLDRGASLVVLGANSVIRWRLARARGELPLPEAEGLDAARNLPLDSLQHVEVGGRRERDPVEHAPRPLQGLSRNLDDAGVGLAAAALSVLQQAGLAERAVVVPVRDGRLQGPSHLDGPAETGDLVRQLEAARGILEVEHVDRESCGLAELALLHRCGADLLVPARESGALHGLLAVRSGRGGLASYRSGEVLALELLGLWLGGRLAETAKAPADVPAWELEEIPLDAVPLEAV